jgi:hypothetical protein
MVIATSEGTPMELLIQLLVTLLILVVVWYIIRLAAQHFGFGEPILTIIGLILGLLFLLYALRLLGIGFK